MKFSILLIFLVHSAFALMADTWPGQWPDEIDYFKGIFEPHEVIWHGTIWV